MSVVSNEEEKQLVTKPDGDKSLEQLTTKKIITSLRNIVQRLLNENELNSENLLYIVTNIMNAVGNYKNTSGAAKKEIVIILINDAIKERISDKNLESILIAMVPNAIDLLVDISKNKYKFKNLSKLSEVCKSLKCC